MILIIVLILLSFDIIYYIIYVPLGNNFKLLTVLFSCDRNRELNLTINTFYYHLKKYERNISINFYFVDSGTPNRMEYIHKYNIKNFFFMNPNHYEYSYGMFWSYLHGKYVLFLEDDRPFKQNIEKFIFYPNYIEEAILLLDKTNQVKGIQLRDHIFGDIEEKTIKSAIGIHILCIETSPPWGYYFINGPTVYKVNYLSRTGYYKSEPHMSNIFKLKRWYTGFTYKGLYCNLSCYKSTKEALCNRSVIYSSKCQGVSYHSARQSTQNIKRTICKRPLY